MLDSEAETATSILGLKVRAAGADGAIANVAALAIHRMLVRP